MFDSPPAIIDTVERVLDKGNIKDAERKTIQNWFPFEPVNVPSFTDDVIIPIIPVLGQIADKTTTEIALNRGLVETNRFLGQDKRVNRIILGTVYAGGQAIALKWLKKHGVSRRVRVVIAVLGFSAGGIPATINLCRIGGRC
jgi:hypothetical protein